LLTRQGYRRMDISRLSIRDMESPREHKYGKYITVGGIKIRYIVIGAGSPVLLIHGFGEFLETWGFSIFPLSERYMVYAIDLPGFGLSDKPVINYSIPSITKFVSDFMQALGIERASLIGHSLGGAIGLSMAVNFPDKLNKLIVVDSSLSKETPFFYRLCTLPLIGEALMMPTIKAGLRHGIKRGFYNQDLVTEEWVDKSYELLKMPGAKRAILSIIRSNANFSGLCPETVIADKLHLAKVPTLFIHGEQDMVIPLIGAQNTCNLIPGARFEVIEECGHCPHIEKPTEFNEAVMAFLESSELSEVQDVG